MTSLRGPDLYSCLYTLNMIDEGDERGSSVYRWFKFQM